MRPRTAYRKRFADKPNLYQEITDQIIAELEAGCVPWVQPWGSSGINAALGLPKNVATGRQYSGINILILWFPPRQPFPDRCRCRLPLVSGDPRQRYPCRGYLWLQLELPLSDIPGFP